MPFVTLMFHIFSYLAGSLVQKKYQIVRNIDLFWEDIKLSGILIILLA